jgi:hypothetical protein
MQFEVSEEEVVRIVRRREGYSLLKSFWKSPLSKGLIIVGFSTLIVTFILNTVDASKWCSEIISGISLVTWLILIKRIYGRCRSDAKTLLFALKDKIQDP